MLVYIRHPLGKHGHDEVWKAACREVGCEPRATRKTEEPYTPTRTLPDKYIVRCNNCGAESRYKQESKVVKLLLHKKRGAVVCRKCHYKDFDLIRL